MPNHWLIKTEPFKYAWDDLVADGETVWDGVRNHRAANNLRAMAKGDPLFWYHSREGLEIVAIAEVSEAGLLDPTDADGKWPTVKVRPVKKLARPVTLKEIKAEPALEGIELVRLSRLSVAKITDSEWKHILAMSER
ncbi:EVE domain-containing protein [Erythrobacter arachoides]|uniref:EVE domain-containing protein n=1 Tax=Aurantiacibacter arachoides TaxID=1850444 RepID=A0A845A0D5_9SPHN|nr:EVE domain-containing protein [Aurantiacibacter arachoides]MXO92932.1 EVE domain-containing protein [Aurantiacibacter arachoides]GGD53325.1 ubiquinol-cytochrome c reductase [Aurantiacibacter arachoides]